MAPDGSSRQATLRTFIVFALAACTLTLSLPDIRRLWQPEGELGFGYDFHTVVNFVKPQSGADKAGVKLGDRVDIRATNPDSRFPLGTNTTYLPGQVVTCAMVRGSHERMVTIVTEPEPMDSPTKWLIIGRELSMLLFVGIGAALVLLQPSVVTWAFYLFCLGSNGAPSSILLALLPTPLNWAAGTLYFALQTAGIVGLAVFAALFLHEHDQGWRGVVYRFAPFVWLILFGIQMYFLIGQGWFGWPVGTAGISVIWLSAAIQAFAVCTLLATYISARGADRQRIRWVVFGFGIAIIAVVANLVVNNFFQAWPYWVHASLALIYIVVPLTVAYAVVKHRIIDVSFVVSRALVYAVLTTLLVGIFSLIDWFFTDYLSSARLGTVAEVGAVLAFGFWFNGLHRRVDTIVDTIFFRQRHRAEVRLTRAAAALPLVSTTDAVARFLVREPTEALSLASAALFRRVRDGVYTRQEAFGWDAGNLSALDSTDETMLALALAEGGPLSLYEHPWRGDGVPGGPAKPVLALPIIVRRELAAIAFYGSHVHGEGLDPDEIRAIGMLAPAAAVAYEHLDAESLRRENEAMRNEVETLRGVIAEFQIQPT